MAFASLKDYNVNAPQFKFPDLSSVFEQVKSAYLSDKSGEIMANGIESAGKSIASIPKQIQEQELAKAKTNQLNAEAGALKEKGLIANAPTPQIVGYQGPTSPSMAGVGGLPTSTTLQNVPAADFTDTGLPEPEWQVPSYDSVSTPTTESTSAGDVLNGGVVQPVASAAQRLAAVAVSPEMRNAAQAGLLTTPQATPAITTEAIPGGALMKRLNGTPTEILEDHKFRSLTKAEQLAINPKAAASDITATEKLALMKEGILPEGATQQEVDFTNASKAKTVIPKLDRDLQKRVNELNIATAGKTADAVRAEVADKLAVANQLTDSQITHMNQVQQKYKLEPPYKNWINVTDGFENAINAATLKSGLGDKALIEEGQRILNPNTAVAVQTMKNFGTSAGLLERISPTYIAENVTKGAILTDGQRAEYLGILKKALSNRAKEMDSVRSNYLQQAKNARVPEDTAAFYLNNPYEEAVKRINNLNAGEKEAAKPAGFDATEASAWLSANPTDPRAGAVRDKLKTLGFIVP